MRIYQSNLSVQSQGGVPDLKDYRSVPAGNRQPPQYVPDEPEEDDNEDFGDSQLFEPDGAEEEDYQSEQGEEEQDLAVSGQEYEGSSDEDWEGSEGEVPAASPREQPIN